MVTQSELTDFYNGKKIFVTGHTGFKGSWLTLWLHLLGAEIIGYALPLPLNLPSLYDQLHLDELCNSVLGDINDSEKLENAILSFQPDIIFHLAAQPLVRHSYSFPKYTFETNFNGTVNLLEVVRKLEKPCSVIIITTDKVYENIEQDYAYNENDKLGGYDPYSASKAVTEIAVSSYRNSFFNPLQYEKHHKGIASARAGNVIGGGDYSMDRIIPDIVKAIAKEQPIIIRNPHSIRPWQFVLEPLWGYLVLGKSLSLDPINFSTSFNLGPDKEDKLTVEDLVKNAVLAFGKGEYSIQQDADQPHEAYLLQLDNKKAKELLKVYPKYSSEKAIIETIKWYKEAKSDYRNYSIKQINKFYSE